MRRDIHELNVGRQRKGGYLKVNHALRLKRYKAVLRGCVAAVTVSAVSQFGDSHDVDSGEVEEAMVRGEVSKENGPLVNTEAILTSCN